MRGRVLRRLVIIAVLGAFGLAPNTVFAQAQKPQVPEAAASDPSALLDGRISVAGGQDHPLLG
jgi:hypothetical protein